MYRRPRAAFSGFVRTALVSDETEVARDVEAVHASAAPQDGADSSTVLDVLACSRGRRDRCCGSEATLLAQALCTVHQRRNSGGRATPAGTARRRGL